MSVRARLLLVSLLTLAVGMGALLIMANVLLRSGVNAQASSVLRARTQAQLAAQEDVEGDRQPDDRDEGHQQRDRGEPAAEGLKAPHSMR